MSHAHGNIRRRNVLPAQFVSQPPIPGAGYSAPPEGPYLCRSDTHPVGEASGPPDHNAARAVLRDAAAREAPKDPPDVDRASTDMIGAETVGDIQARWMPQKDGCCGPFWGAIALRAFGIESFEGEVVDQDLLAVHSGTTLDEGDPYGALPPRCEPRLDYRLALPVAGSSATSGTSAHGVADGIERVGTGRVSVVPVAGPWTADSVELLLDTMAEVSPDAVLIANWATRHLWGSRPTPAVVLAHLAGQEFAGPPAEWDVGHFANLVALLRGPGGSFIVVRDSYSVFGWEGHHLQPPSAAAAALRRGGGKEGGVLVVVRATAGDEVRRSLAKRGFELRHWDNGTPYERS